MPRVLRLDAGPLSAEVVPALGGGVARFDLVREGEIVNIFRPWPEGGSSDPRALGMIVLTPWSNRISGGGFMFGGAFHPLRSNVPGEPFPIHGDAWQGRWSVAARDNGHLRLTRDAGGPGPFNYRARLDYDLSSDTLSIRLDIVNQGGRPLPFGGGFHPWLPRSPGTTLFAPARTVWIEDKWHLPTEQVPVAAHPEWDFSHPRPLPMGWINNGFTGWNGRAAVRWDEHDLALDILADEPIGTYILYSPSADATFFCLEPVTHVVDAHNLAPGPEAHGLVVLAPGASLAMECRFRVRSGPAPALSRQREQRPGAA